MLARKKKGKRLSSTAHHRWLLPWFFRYCSCWACFGQSIKDSEVGVKKRKVNRQSKRERRRRRVSRWALLTSADSRKKQNASVAVSTLTRLCHSRLLVCCCWLRLLA